MINSSHPGDVLTEFYLAPLGITPRDLADALHAPAAPLERLAEGSGAVTPELAVRLGRYFRTTPELWMNMQTAWDLARAREATNVDAIVPVEAA